MQTLCWTAGGWVGLLELRLTVPEMYFTYGVDRPSGSTLVPTYISFVMHGLMGHGYELWEIYTGVGIQPEFNITIYTPRDKGKNTLKVRRRKGRQNNNKNINRTERIIRSKQTDATKPWAAYTLHVQTDLCHCPQSHLNRQ